MHIQPIHNNAPVAEVEIYRDIISQAVSQLNILLSYDERFLIPQSQMIIHRQQLDLTIDAMNESIKVAN